MAFLRFDMSEYMEKHTVSRLIGAPPGYVGFDQGGLLTDAVRKTPHAVLLLDEIEKAHPDLFNILLQVMDHATLTDNNGRKADFRHVILIMTTNVGRAGAVAARKLGFGDGVPRRRHRHRRAREGVLARSSATASTPWCTSRRWGAGEIERVVDKNVKELAALLADRDVTLELTPEARAWLAENGYDPAFGARPMARLVEKHAQEAAGRGDPVREPGRGWARGGDPRGRGAGAAHRGEALERRRPPRSRLDSGAAPRRT